MVETETVCPSCRDLDIKHKTSHYGMGEFRTQPQRMVDAANNGCQVCQLLWHGLNYFAKRDNFDALFEYQTNIDIALPTHDYPLTVYAWSDQSMDIEFFTLTDSPSPWPEFAPASLISSRSDDTGCFKLIDNWISQCEMNHLKCKAEKPTPLPSRVIKIHRSYRGFEPVLYQSKGEAARFAALSYCWGSDLPLRTVKANLSLHFKKIKWSAIPKTIQDAIEITHRLGLEFLWVDSLTIVQDDPVDWAKESAKMGQIYSDAYFTIAATHACGCQVGCFSSRSQDTFQAWSSGPPLPEHRGPDRDANLGPILARPTRYRGVFSYPLSTRAWALQEHLLSRRVIQYLPSELLWHCRECSAWESRPKMRTDGWGKPGVATEAFRPISIRLRDPDDPQQVEDVRKLWGEVADNYAQRNLTRPSDKLSAISGLAKEFQPFLGSYIAGLWENDLLASLTWVSRSTLSYHEPRNHRQLVYAAPSWSWASVMGPVNYAYYREYVDSSNSRCTILKTDVATVTTDRAGPVKSATLMIRAPLLTGKLERVSRVIQDISIDGRISSSTERGKVDIQGQLYSVDLDHIEYLVNDHANKVQEERKTTAAVLSKLRSVYKRLRSDVTTASTEHWQISTPAIVHCLLLGSKPNTYHNARSPTQEVLLILVPSSRVSGSFERIGIAKGEFCNAFQTIPEREITLV